MISGLLWGVVAAYLLRNKGFWGPVEGVRFLALLFAPLLGLFSYYTSRWVYQKKNGIKIIWSVVSVYLASGLYGLILVALTLINKESFSGEHFFEIVLSIWWGITFSLILWLVYPASFLNHLIMAKLENKSVSSTIGKP